MYVCDVTETHHDVWYRHSGEPEIEDLPNRSDLSWTTQKEIIEKLGEHQITHIIVEPKDVDLVKVVAPGVKQLRVRGLL